jgi:hypothetical protein
MNDDETAMMLANDPFHKGLEEHGELPRMFTVEALTDDDVDAARARLRRMMGKDTDQ